MVDEQPADDLSVEQIEGDSWGAPPPGSTALVSRVYELRRKPVGTLTAEDLRVLIAQQVGLDVVVPRALRRLREDPLLEGDYYPGDVLVAVLKVPAEYWAARGGQLAELEAVIAAVDNPDRELARDIDEFRKRVGSA
ncbi:MAG TPA: contact-dependent growth inhibition system immunity protein [Micromonosporaceae bacterium]